MPSGNWLYNRKIITLINMCALKQSIFSLESCQREYHLWWYLYLIPVWCSLVTNYVASDNHVIGNHRALPQWHFSSCLFLFFYCFSLGTAESFLREGVKLGLQDHKREDLLPCHFIVFDQIAVHACLTHQHIVIIMLGPDGHILKTYFTMLSNWGDCICHILAYAPFFNP